MTQFELLVGPQGPGSLEKQWGLLWVEQTLHMCNVIANFFNDSGPAKAQLAHTQTEVYGAKRQITVDIPTRFGSNFFVVETIFNSKAALIQTVGAESWSSVCNAGNGTKVRSITERTFLGANFFWENVDMLLDVAALQ